MASYILEEEFDSLPEPVVNAAMRQIANSVANMIGGYRSLPSQILLRVLSPLAGADQATILATGAKVPVLHAVCVNANLANALDYDDMFSGPGFGGHPGSAIVPPALALAEYLNSSGEDLIAAVVVGFETAVRVGAAIAPSPERAKHILPLATWQSLGAVAAAARLLHLNPDQTSNAIGLAAVLMPLPSGKKWGELRGDPGPVSWAKNGYGWASMGAVFASQLAAEGFLGNPGIFEGPNGFWVMAGSDRFEQGKLLAGLGKEYAILRGSLKRYPACWHAQSSLEALAELRKETPIVADDVDEVTLAVCAGAALVLANYERMTPVGIPFSLSYLTALALLDKPLLDVSEKTLQDRQLQALARRVTVCEGDEPTPPGESPATVSIRLRSGQTVSKTVTVPKGDYRGPLTDDELYGKCKELMQGIVGARTVERVLGDLPKLTTCAGVGDMVRRWYAA
jgi:2-methylcitrate dehydratase PrpD